MNFHANERLAMLSAQETLTAIILQELSQPLAMAKRQIALLRPLAEAASALVEGDAVNPTLDRLDHAVGRCALIISRMRALVIDERPVRSVVGVDAIFREALRTIEGEPGWDRVEVEIDTFEAPDPALCDPVQIEQVVVNLLLNAIATTRAHPSPKVVLRAISRRTWARGRLVEIIVSDNGPGMRPGEEEEVFRPFYRASNGNTGLGLAICRSLIEMHGGEIHCAPGRSAGALFHFTLPRANS